MADDSPNLHGFPVRRSSPRQVSLSQSDAGQSAERVGQVRFVVASLSYCQRLRKMSGGLRVSTAMKCNVPKLQQRASDHNALIIQRAIERQTLTAQCFRADVVTGAKRNRAQGLQRPCDPLPVGELALNGQALQQVFLR